MKYLVQTDRAQKIMAVIQALWVTDEYVIIIIKLVWFSPPRGPTKQLARMAKLTKFE